MKKIIKTNYSFTFGFICFVLFLSQVSCIDVVGPEGPKGSSGKDGTSFANSAIYDISADKWAGNINGYSTTLTMPEITNDIYNNGAVLVYRLREDFTPKSFNLLPYTYVDNNTTTYMDFDAYIGKIEITTRDIVNGQNASQAPTQLMSFKVVVVIGLPYAKLQQKVNIQDFNAVTKFLGIDKSKIN